MFSVICECRSRGRDLRGSLQQWVVSVFQFAIESDPSRVVKVCLSLWGLGVWVFGCDVNTTPQMTCFRGAKVCTKWPQEKVTIKSYSLTTSWKWEQVTS